MNIFGSIIAGTLVTVFLITLVSTLLNLRASLAPLPTEFRDLYTDEAYGNSQAYLRQTSRLSLFSSAFDLILLFVFWFFGGFNLLDQLLRGLGLHSIMTGVLYIGALLLLQSVLSLPFTLYRTFVIEEKFGFNRTTPRCVCGRSPENPVAFCGHRRPSARSSALVF